MARLFHPAVVALVTAAVMCVDCVRVLVCENVSVVWTHAVSKPTLSIAVLVGALLLYAWLHFRSLQAPLVDVPPTIEEADPVRTAPRGVQPGTIRSDAHPGVILCWDPATNEYLGEVQAMTAAQVQDTVTRARKAQRKWATTTFAERRKVMKMLSAAILHRQDEILDASIRDSGKTYMDGILGEIMTTLEKIAWIVREGEDALKPSYRNTSLMMVHKSARVEYVPVGVMGVIAPWNYPFHNMLNHIISGLFAGNAVVSKPSEYTSWSGGYTLRLVRAVLAAAGHSPDLVQVVTGFADCGAGLVASDVDKIIFTGSPGIGRHVMRGCADVLKPVVLELGGKDPVVVCEDADFEQVMPYALRGSFGNCGQNCIGIERVYVYEPLYEKFVKRVGDAAKAMRQGAPLTDVTMDAGAMTMPAQIAIIDELVQDAVRKGARLVCGGKRRTDLPGFFYEPTVLADVTHDMRIANEEVFGPVMSIFKITGGDKQLISLVNSTEYGLGSSVFTTDLVRGERIQRAIRAGMTCINDFGLNYMAQSLPFGGVGISGFGRFGGAEGLRACCHMKSIINDIVPGIRTQIPGVIQYPLNSGSPQFSKGLMGMMYAPTVWGKIRGIIAMITARRGPSPAAKKSQ